MSSAADALAAEINAAAKVLAANAKATAESLGAPDLDMVILLIAAGEAVVDQLPIEVTATQIAMAMAQSQTILVEAIGSRGKERAIKRLMENTTRND